MTEVNVLWTPAWHRKLYDSIKSAKHEILLVSPWLKMSGAELIVNAVIENSNGAPKLSLLTTLEEQDLIGKTTISDLEAYILLQGYGFSVRVVRGLHAKIYLFDDSEAIVTSGNLTARGLGRADDSNLEIALHLTSPHIVSTIKSGLLPVWEQSEPLTNKRLKSMAVRISNMPSMEEIPQVLLTQEEDPVASLAFNAPRWQTPKGSKGTTVLKVAKSGKDLLALVEGDAELLEARDIIQSVNLRTRKLLTSAHRMYRVTDDSDTVEIAMAGILNETDDFQKSKTDNFVWSEETTNEPITQIVNTELIIHSTTAISNTEFVKPKMKAVGKKASALHVSRRDKIASESLLLFADAKSTTVRKLATEINVSHRTLIGFLQKAGFKSVKTIMSKIEPEAQMRAIKHFGKDKDIIEKRRKKVAAFKEKRAKSHEDFLAKHPDLREREDDFAENPKQASSRPKKKTVKKSGKRKLKGSVRTVKNRRRQTH